MADRLAGAEGGRAAPGRPAPPWAPAALCGRRGADGRAPGAALCGRARGGGRGAGSGGLGCE